ncbi:MAG: type II toxin-antitoxin system death-on-curing family toxin [Planctomycetota bacterium]
MSDPIFVSYAQVRRLHRLCLEQHGGQDGLRDPGLVEAAVGMPQSTFAGQLLHPDLAAQASAYLFHLCRNHGFLDGNKRVAVGTAETFLRLNGYRFSQSDDELESLIVGVASGELDKDALSAALADIVAV